MSAGEAEIWSKTMPKILAKAWTDASFKQRLMSAPQDVFKEYGLPLSAGTRYEMKEGPAFSCTVTLCIPSRPPDLKELSMEDAIVAVLRQGPPDGKCADFSCF